jgi:predicted dehydrogenase
MPTPSLTIAVVGCGHWGPNHIRVFGSLPGVAVRWAVDSDAERREYISSSYDRVKVTDDLAVALRDREVSAIVVSTPAITHYDVVQQAIDAGKHVLCEKPLSVTAAESERLMRAAEAKQVVLMVGHVFLFNAGIRKLKNLISTGDVGRPHYASAIRTNLGPIREDTNVVFDLAAHEVSIFNFLFDSTPTAVTASGRALLRPGLQDFAFVTLHYPNGAIVGVSISWLSPKKVREITLVGEKKMIVWDDLASSPVVIYEKGVPREPYYDTYGEFQLLTRQGNVSMPKIEMEEPLRRQARFFVEAIAQGDATICSGVRGWEVVKTLEAINESLRREGVPVAVDGDHPRRDG